MELTDDSTKEAKAEVAEVSIQTDDTIETDETSAHCFKIGDQLEGSADDGYGWNGVVKRVGYYVLHEDENGFGKEYYVDNFENKLRRIGVGGISKENT